MADFKKTLADAERAPNGVPWQSSARPQAAHNRGRPASLDRASPQDGRTLIGPRVHVASRLAASGLTLSESPLSESPGLHLLCIEYVGFKLTKPDLDLQFDLSAEYAMAKEMSS